MIEDTLKKTPWSGYTLSVNSFETLRERFLFYLAVERDRREIPLFWVALIGGTGTGKSTIFNSLAGSHISLTGVERPKTRGPIAAFPRGTSKVKLACFTTVQTPISEPTRGTPGVLTVTEHRLDLPWVFIDSPDIDSLARDHHKIAEDIFFLSDFILFVLSQEKYADERLNRFLRRIVEEGKNFFVVVNKATKELGLDDVVRVFRSQGFYVDKERLIFIPFAHPEKGQLRHLEAWKELERRFYEIAGNNRWKTIRDAENERSRFRTLNAGKELVSILKRERDALLDILKDIKDLTDRAAYEVLEKHITTVKDHTKAHLQPQIKALYSRYDIFGKPRRAVTQAISKVFEILGIRLFEEDEDSKEATIKRIEQQIDHSPIFYAMDFLVSEVLRRIPSDREPIGYVIRTPETVLSHEDVQNIMIQNSREIFDWLESKFQTLMEGIPKTKELGIYSSFALWGVFILGIEAAVGGGLSLVKAAIDAVIAPFITKATVELFASHEIYSIVEELSARYKKGLQSVIFLQRDRFTEAIRPFIPGEDLLTALEDFDSTEH